MAPVVLADFILPIDIDSFYDHFWSDSVWYEGFLVKQLLDLSVNVGEWSNTATNQFRNIRSYHPSKISFPGLPSHAESLKVQTMEMFNSDKERKIIIKESNSFRGIPYADYFNVNTEWIVTSILNPSINNTERPKCYVTIHLDFTFHKSTWLQGTIESNTKAELIGVFELWKEAADVTIKQAAIAAAQAAKTAAITSSTVATAEGEANKENVNNNNTAATTLVNSESMMDMNNDINMLGTRSRSKSQEEDNPAVYPYSSSGYGSDEEMQFYDCEEGGIVSSERTQLIKGSSRYASRNSMDSSGHNSNYYRSGKDSNSNIHLQRGGSASSQSLNDRAHTPPELHQFYGQHGHTGTIALPQSNGDKDGTDHEFGVEQTSARDLAVSIVETVFVLAEFSFWKVHTMYMYDLKELFNVEPHKVLSRILNSFLPGWHTPILLQPDIYGPLLAVFLLPQSLLISMETSKHGCNPTSQLGNAVVVSLFIWIGLSCLYRLLSLIIAPTIGLKHCLSMTGYSFFSWNLALLCSFPLELYGDVLRIPMMLPLVILGIPSSLALGCMFWEQTPASTIQLQPASLPTSMQQFAANNSRWLQRVLWAFPKILAFVLVTGTHYQFLWYMARVFLPGRKQLCQLSALVQPSQYADILTQKELRKFAIMLLLGKKDE